MTKQKALSDQDCCPLCGESNRCASARGEAEECWCMNVKIPKEVLQRVPDQLKGKSCICQTCTISDHSKTTDTAEQVSATLFVDATI